MVRCLGWAAAAATVVVVFGPPERVERVINHLALYARLRCQDAHALRAPAPGLGEGWKARNTCAAAEELIGVASVCRLRRLIWLIL